MGPQTTPIRLNLKKDEKLEIEWQDGLKSSYSIAYLRSRCPCAACREFYEQQRRKSSRSLTVLPAGAERPLKALSAELVGNYALKIDWSDSHDAGIYSFEYLRQISPEAPRP